MQSSVKPWLTMVGWMPQVWHHVTQPWLKMMPFWRQWWIFNGTRFWNASNESTISLSYYIINLPPLNIICSLEKNDARSYLSVDNWWTVSVSHGPTLCQFKDSNLPYTESFWCSNTITFRLLCKRKRNSMTLIHAVCNIIESAIQVVRSPRMPWHEKLDPNLCQ